MAVVPRRLWEQPTTRRAEDAQGQDADPLPFARSTLTPGRGRTRPAGSRPQSATSRLWPRDTPPAPAPLPGSLEDSEPISACAVRKPRLFVLLPVLPAANMAAFGVSCGAAASYRLFLGGRVSFARGQGLWKAAAAKLQRSLGCQVRPERGGSAGPWSTRVWSRRRRGPLASPRPHTGPLGS